MAHDKSTPTERAYLAEYERRLNLETIRPALRSVHLYGELSEVVGETVLEFEVSRPCDLFRALLTQIPEAREVVVRGDWRILEGDRELEAWELYVSRPDSLEPLHIIPAPEGEGRGFLKIFGGVFLAFLAPWAAPALGGLIGVEIGVSTIFGLGAITALSGVAQALAPVPPSDFMEREEPQARRPTLFSAGTTLNQKGAPVPLAYGLSLCGAVRVSLLLENHLNLPYVTEQRITGGWGDWAEIDVSQKFSAIDLVSEGEILGIGKLAPFGTVLTSKSGIYQNDMPMLTEGAGDNSPSVNFSLATGAPSVGAGLSSDIGRPFSVRSLCEQSVPTSFVVYDSDVDDVILSLSFGALYSATSSTPPTDRVVEFDLEVSASGGTPVAVSGKVSPYETNYFTTGTPPLSFDIVFFYASIGHASPQAAAVTTTSQSGTHPDIYGLTLWSRWIWDPSVKWPPNSTPTTEDEYAPLDLRLYYRAPAGSGGWQFIEQTVYNPRAGSFQKWSHYLDVEWNLDLPASQTSVEFYLDTADPARRPGAVGYGGITVHRGSAYHWLSQGRVYGQSTAPFFFDVRVSDLSSYGAAPWEISVTRTSSPSSGYDRDEFKLDSYHELITRDFDFPGAALVEMTGLAEDLSTSSPNFRYEVAGIKVRVPVGYGNGITGSPSDPWYGVWPQQMPAVWTGAFDATRQFCTDPAWILWDILTDQTGYGLGLSDDQVDRWSFAEASRRNGEVVPDWTDGNDPAEWGRVIGYQLRYQWNGSVNRRDDAIKALTAIASSMDAQLWVGSGIVYLTQDRPGPTGFVFNNSNVLGGNFEYIGTAASGRKNVARVSWRSPANLYQPEIEQIERPYQIDRFGRRETDVDAIGVTSKGQAGRRGKYVVVTAEKETQQVAYKISIENALMAPGDIIEIADERREGARHGGRVVSSGPFGIYTWYVVDAPSSAPFPPAAGYTFSTVLDDGSFHSAAITNTTSIGDFQVFTSGNISPKTCPPGAPFVITTPTVAPKKFRVLSIAEDSPQVFEVTAVEHDPDKWTLIDDPTEIGSPTSYPADTWPPP